MRIKVSRSNVMMDPHTVSIDGEYLLDVFGLIQVFANREVAEEAARRHIERIRREINNGHRD